MKSKNTFKKPVITYDPIVQEKQPIWMHSVQTYRTSRTTIWEVLLLVAIFAGVVLAWRILS
jgi:hypothetical protein